MNQNKDQRDDLENDEVSAKDNETSAAAGGEALDLEGLDLTVETVEERISPSETNVFDK
ncbi:MAG: hypothetical protein P8M11_14580 [Planctomycetota bacterium]|nr:hypothetical protein [Planctomycetota bacterium]MDG1985781.1 hypothetical protein [Planctomycetota bacterium]